MPFGSRPCCISCETKNAAVWRKDSDGKPICHSCFNKPIEKEDSLENHNNGNGQLWKPPGRDRSAVGSQYVGPIRKSARIKPAKHKYQAIVKPLATKGKSRRIVFKKNPIKSAPSVATVVASDYIFHDNIYWQRGDIASVMDEDDGGIYYAQLRGFLQDQYNDKSAVITWLIPTLESPLEGFDASSFILGPEEELPRKMECFEFVCRAPSDYFRSYTSPYETKSTKPDLGYVWTTIGEQIMPPPSDDEIYGLQKDKLTEKTEKLTAKERRLKKKEKLAELLKKEKKEPLKDKKEPLKDKKDPLKDKKEPLKDKKDVVSSVAVTSSPATATTSAASVAAPVSGPKTKNAPVRRERIARKEKNKPVAK